MHHRRSQAAATILFFSSLQFFFFSLFAPQNAPNSRYSTVRRFQKSFSSRCLFFIFYLFIYSNTKNIRKKKNNFIASKRVFFVLNSREMNSTKKTSRYYVSIRISFFSSDFSLALACQYGGGVGQNISSGTFCIERERTHIRFVVCDDETCGVRALNTYGIYTIYIYI